MGIDIYARWPGQTTAERDARVTGFGIAHGHVGYLREAYHGGPYATQVLVPEAFNERYEDGAPIEAATMRRRLSEVLRTASERQWFLYDELPGSLETQIVLKSFTDFVELCEGKEAETGEPCRIVASY